MLSIGTQCERFHRPCFRAVGNVFERKTRPNAIERTKYTYWLNGLPELGRKGEVLRLALCAPVRREANPGVGSGIWVCYIGWGLRVVVVIDVRPIRSRDVDTLGGTVHGGYGNPYGSGV